MQGRERKRTELEPLKIKLYQQLSKKQNLTTIEKNQLFWLSKDPDLGGWKINIEKGFM